MGSVPDGVPGTSQRVPVQAHGIRTQVWVHVCVTWELFGFPMPRPYPDVPGAPGGIRIVGVAIGRREGCGVRSSGKGGGEWGGGWRPSRGRAVAVGTARRWLGLERRPPLPQLTRGCRGTNPSPPVPEGRKVTWRDRFSVPPPLREAPACLWPRGWADVPPWLGGTGARAGAAQAGPQQGGEGPCVLAPGLHQLRVHQRPAQVTTAVGVRHPHALAHSVPSCVRCCWSSGHRSHPCAKEKGREPDKGCVHRKRVSDQTMSSIKTPGQREVPGEPH